MNGSSPPLALQLFDTEWRYLGSQERTALYRPIVSFETNTTTIRLENVSFRAVETDLGATPPGRLNETDHPKEIAWLSQEFEAVVTVGEFDAMWERRLEILVETGNLTVANGNNSSTFAPLSPGEFVAHDGRFHRIALRRTDGRIVLGVTPADDETVLSEADIDVVTTDELPSDVRETVLRAIRDENGYTRFRRGGVNVSRLDDLRRRLIRHDGTYYMLKRGHVDDINLVPLFRSIVTLLGGVVLLGGAGLEWRARTN